MKAATCGWSNLVMFQVQDVKDTLHIILRSLYVAGTDWLSLVQAAAKRDLTFVRLTTMCPYCLQVCCHMLSPVFFKPAMSPTKSNSGSFRDVFNNDVCVSFFCICTSRRRKTEDDCCLVWLLCECCRSGGTEQRSVWWNRLRSEQTVLDWMLDLVWAVSGQTVQHCSRKVNSIRDSEKTRQEWEEGRERKTERTFISSLDDLKAWGTKESLSMASMSFILRTCSSRETPSETHKKGYEQKQAHV